MKFKSILTLALFLVLSAGSAYGLDDQSVTAEATVLEDLVLDSPQGVAFGNIPQDISGGAPSIDATAFDTYSNIQSGTVTRGVVTISGTAAAEVAISVPGTVVLSNGTEELDFSPTIAFAEGSNLEGAGSIVSNPETLDGSGDGIVYVGGTLAAGTGNTASSLASGAYSGSVNVTVEYSNL